MTTKTAGVFMLGFLAGAVFSAAIVSWKWNRDFEDLRNVQIAGQAHVAAEIYASRSEELAESILRDLPGYSLTSRGRVERAYDESGRDMPERAKEILSRWPRNRN
jgi:hypothetical protein